MQRDSLWIKMCVLVHLVVISFGSFVSREILSRLGVRMYSESMRGLELLNFGGAVVSVITKLSESCVRLLLQELTQKHNM